MVTLVLPKKGTRIRFGDDREAWDVDKPLCKDEERRAAQVEIDAIVALSLEVTADELYMIYWTHFPVVRRHDRKDRFDNRTLDWVDLERLTVIAEGCIAYAYASIS